MAAYIRSATRYDYRASSPLQWALWFGDCADISSKKDFVTQQGGEFTHSLYSIKT
jgi:hypothetical protein